MECLENATVYTVANLCQSILTIEFLEDERSEGRLVSNQLLLSLCRHLGVAPEEGGIREIKCQIPHISPPYAFDYSDKVAKQGAYMRDATVYASKSFIGRTIQLQLSHSIILSVIFC